MTFEAGQSILFTLSPEREIAVVLLNHRVNESVELVEFHSKVSSPEEDIKKINKRLRPLGLVAVNCFTLDRKLMKYKLTIQHIQ